MAEVTPTLAAASPMVTGALKNASAVAPSSAARTSETRTSTDFAMDPFSVAVTAANPDTSLHPGTNATGHEHVG